MITRLLATALILQLGMLPARATETFKDRHPRWYKIGTPVRLTFKGFCAVGKWSERTGLTSGLTMLGAAGACATPFVVGFTGRK